MKTKLFIVLLIIANYISAQSEITNPHFGHSTGQGKVVKVELLEDVTVLHFDIMLYTTKPCHIPSSSYLQPVGSDEKYFVKDSEGVVLDEEFEVPGKLRKKYKLIFPKLPDNVTHVKFDEFEHGTWEIHGLEIRGFKDLPKELVGNWLKTDGSNLWHHSFYNNKAIIGKTVWQYESIEKEGKLYKITLKNKVNEKTIYAKIKNEKTISFGDTKNALLPYTTEKIFTKKYDYSDDVYTESNMFKIDSAVYSGVIANYNKASNYKTGTIHVNNVFTGSQETYLVKINEDGGFSVKFPLYYPQEIYVRFPNYPASIFVEPGKESWHLIETSSRNNSFYSGDMGIVNTQLNHFVYSYRNIEDYKKLNEKNILPKDYKALCYSLYDKNSRILDSVLNNNVLSTKTIQIMKLNTEYRHYENLISYEIHHERGAAKDSLYITDSTYVDFFTPKVFKNKLATLTSSYSGFINRLEYSKHVRKNNRSGIRHPEAVELAKILKEKGVELTKEEQDLVLSQEKFKKDNAIALKKQKDFNDANKDVFNSFGSKIGSVWQKIDAKDRKEVFSKADNLAAIIAYLKPLGVEFTEEEIKVVNSQKHVLTKEENQKFKDFYTKELNAKNKAFTDKYKSEIQTYIQNKIKAQSLEGFNEFFDGKSPWVLDLLISQKITRPIKEEVTPLSDDELESNTRYLKDEFVKNQLHLINANALAKIEENKTKTGYILNETPKTEADKVFDSIIKKYKGKVVFVDFWATWCGPCRSGMTKMKPLKEEFKDEDVVFVYITNHTSPEKTYKNMIPDIKGEHYKVSSDQWNYLTDKFKITGIPHYTLVNKGGVVVNDKIPNRSNETLKSLFKQELDKK